MIDDDAGIARVVSVGLIARELGMEFRAITSPLIANEVFAAYRPDIVIIDMAEKDGIEVLSKILATGVPTKVVLTSGLGDVYLRLGIGVTKCHGIEGVPLLKKPFRRAELIELLNMTLQVCPANRHE